MSYRVDEIDQRILYHLVVDARNTSAPTIAEEVDVTPATIRNRIRQLEEHGVVRGYHAAVDYEATDGKVTTEFTCTAPVGRRSQVAGEAGAVSGVVGVRELLTGQRNLVVTAVGTDTDDVDRIAQQLSSLELTIEREAIVRDETVLPYEPFAPEDDRPRSAVRDFQSVVGGAEVVEFTVPADAAIAGRTLEAANRDGLLPDEVLVVSIERDGERITPVGDTVVEAGDVVSVFSPEAFPEDIVRAFEAGAGPDAASDAE